MQDVPLTMELVRRRLGRHSGPRAVVTGTGGEPRRSTWAETGERAARLRGALAQMRIDARRPRRHLRAQPPPPPGADAGRAGRGRGAEPGEHPPDRRAGGLDPQPLDGPGAVRRRRADRAAGPGPRPARVPGAGDRDRRRVRGPAGRRRAGPVTGDRGRGRRAGPLLHVGHGGRPQGRAVLAPLDDPARAVADDGRQPRRLARRHGHAHHRRVPRAGVVAALRRRAHRRRPGAAGAVERSAPPGPPDRVRGRDHRRRRAHRVAGHGAAVRRRRVRPVLDARAAHRRHARAQAADPPLPRARDHDRPGLGHDRDVAQRDHVARDRRGRGGVEPGHRDAAGGAAPDGRRRRRAGLGRRRRSASWRCAARA